MTIAIIQYNAGNACSVAYTLERIGVTPVITDDAEVISAADKVIFPGVGAAGAAMQYLQNKRLDILLMNLRQPVLGICLGMQLMCDFSEEGNTRCLSIFSGQAVKFTDNIKVPHMGWNNISQLTSPLFQGVPENTYVYFAHSYYTAVTHHTIAIASYGSAFGCAMKKDNFYGVQFHPEKSGVEGQRILENFIGL